MIVIEENTVTVISETEIEVVSVGIKGEAGQGVPTGGASGEVLAKASNDDYDTEWIELGTAAFTDATDYATAAQGALADSALQPAAIGVTVQGYSAALQGTSASFTTTLETKLNGIQAGAEVNVNADWNASSGDAQILNKPTIPDASLLVPYTGATANLNLGAFDITATRNFTALGTALLPSYSFTGDANTGMFSPTADALALSTSGAERMRISSQGYIGINTTDPQAEVHIKEGSLPSRPPNPTGTVTLSETNIDSGYWANTGNSFAVAVYTYKLVGGDVVYSASSISAFYDDDYNGDHTYDLLLELSGTLPAGADGYRAFVSWFDGGGSGEYVWNYDRYVQFSDSDAVINNSALSGTHSSARVNKTIHENLQRYYKNSTVRFMDSSNNTYAMWDSSTNRLGVGTTSPVDFVHFKGEVTTLPSNPTGTATATEVTGYDDPYYNDGNTNSYRVHTYKLANGKVVISTGYLSCSYTDDGLSDHNYSVQISMSAAAPAGTNGYCVFRLNDGAPNLSSYLLTASTTIDQGAFTSTPAAQTSILVSNFVIDSARIQMLDSSGNETFSLDGNTGAFTKLNVIATSPSTVGLQIKQAAGATAPSLVIKNSSDVSVLTVSVSGNITTSAGINCTTGNFSQAVTINSFLTSKTAFISPVDSSNNALVIKAVTGQSAPLLRIDNSSSAQQFAIANNGRDFILDTTTGTKIGTSNSQKLGFWGIAPVVRPTTSVAAATFVVNSGGSIHPTSTFDGYTIAQVVRALRNIGLLA